MRQEIRIAGFGGQGIILAAVITGKAAAIFEGKEATVMENYGPEARGGACSGTIVVNETKVDYPYTTSPDIMAIMNKASYDKFRPELKKDGILLIEEDLVTLDKNDNADVYKIPATRFAEEFGNKIVANIIMLGFMTGVTEFVSFESMKSAILSSVKPRFKDLNEKAYNRGYEFGKMSRRAGKERRSKNR